ncbi:hypothetical protein [Lacticaseibacillus paracasei]|uniref:hypothetical protein n=1 Tax=Lacticaseibacillus paracasei TaxID=1597 RepID=UPI000FFB89F8|nr:hypothetical protein [Lacticaseibacillus paracasei]
MSNETKRDVFEDLVEELANAYIALDGEGIGHELTHEDKQAYLKDYDSALPDDLPVIPKAWGDTIEEFEANHYRLSEIFTEWAWNYDEQELIARAWVLGVWRVEETGEIVELEAEK